MSRIDNLIARLCPRGVSFKTLGDTGTFIRGNGLQKKDFADTGVGCIHYGQIHTHYRTSATEIITFVTPLLAKRLRHARPGDLVIATTSEDDEAVGKATAWLGTEDVAVSSDAYIYRHSLDPKYVAYFFQSKQFQIQKKPHITGTKVRRVSGKSLARIRIPVPPLDVQREIVEVLDSFTELEAELETKLETELNARRRQYQHYRDALLRFSEQTDADASRQAVTMWSTLGDLVGFISGKPHERVVHNEGDIALMTSKFISTQGKSSRFVKRADVLTPALANDIALVMSDLPNGRALARAYFVDKSNRYAANQRVCLLRVLDQQQVAPKFLYYVLDRNQQLLQYDSGVDQTHLKKEWILQIQVPVPPLEQQEHIVAILDQFGALVNDLSISLSAELKARRKQYQYYRDHLLTFQEAA